MKPDAKYTWSRYTVGSKTGWAGGRVGQDPEEDEVTDVDPRDFGADAEDFNPRTPEVPADTARVGLRRDRVTSGPLAGVDLLHYMRTGMVRKLTRHKKDR